MCERGRRECTDLGGFEGKCGNSKRLREGGKEKALMGGDGGKGESENRNGKGVTEVAQERREGGTEGKEGGRKGWKVKAELVA